MDGQKINNLLAVCIDGIRHPPIYLFDTLLSWQCPINQVACLTFQALSLYALYQLSFILELLSYRSQIVIFSISAWRFSGLVMYARLLI
jgi:hypothetical protein